MIPNSDMRLPVRILRVTLIAFFALTGLPTWARTTETSRPEDALVLVTSRVFGAGRMGHGFVVGDGTRIVTSSPAVFDQAPGGQHRLVGCVTVASPYLGVVADAHLLAFDMYRSLVVLEVPWRGHPSLGLAADASIADASRAVLVGMPQVLAAVGTRQWDRLEGDVPFERILAPVDYVALRDGIPHVLRVMPRQDLGSDWGGVPILTSEACEVTAVLSTLSLGDRTAEGPVLNRVRSLLAGSPPLETSPPVQDAHEAFLLSLRLSRSFHTRQYEQAALQAGRLIALRRDCFYGYVEAAKAAERLGRPQEAEQLHKKALVLAPDSMTAGLSYAVFLEHQDRLDEAMRVLERLWQRADNRPYLSGYVYTVLERKQQYERCIEFIDQALNIEPNNAYAWIHLGNCRNALGQYGRAAEAFGRALELRPQENSTRHALAYNLMRAGRLEEAEAQYHKLLDIEPDDPLVHASFAMFLAEHRPERRAEALEEARTALELPARDGLSREHMERLIRRLESPDD